MAVRFGNVLGSSGSVLTIFQEQLEKGGPLTVTHAEARRFFMTASEAVGLILLSGLEPGKDIEIKFTGLKQGEKLDEELMEDAAGFAVSEHPDIFILRGENQPSPGLDAHLLELELATRGKDAEAVVRRLSELVPTFKPAVEHTPVPRAAP